MEATARLATALCLLGFAGVASGQVLSVSAPAFPVTAVGHSVTQNVTITVSTGGNSVVFNSIALAPGFRDFTLGTITGCVVDGATANTDGAVCTVPVTFAPVLPGSANSQIPLARSVPLLVSDVENGTAAQYAYGLVGGGTTPLPVIVPGIITDIVGTDLSIPPSGNLNGESSEGGPASTARFSNPTNIAVDGAGNIFISDTGNCIVRRVDKVLQTVTTVAGVPLNGCGASAAVDGVPATQSGLNLPTGIALDAAGNLYIADSGDNAVRMVSAATGLMSTVAGTLNTPGTTGDGGPATVAQLNNPQGIAVDGAGNLYIVDAGNYAVRKVQAGTGQITTIAGTLGVSAQGAIPPQGLATSFLFNTPSAIAVDAAGDVFIIDTVEGGLLWRVDAQTQTIAHIYTQTPPGGIGLDASDTLFYTSGCSVYKQPLQNGFAAVSPVLVAGDTAGDCLPAAFSGAGDGGSATLAVLSPTVGIVVDSTGSFYILESEGVRFVDSTGTLPEPVAFGASPLLTPSATQSVQVFNGDIATSAGGSSTPLGVYFSGVSSPFATTPAAFGQDCSLATTTVSIPLNPAAFCTLSMTFTPQTQGGVAASASLFETPSSAMLTQTMTQTLALTGTGGSGIVTVAPALMTLIAPVGVASPSQNFTVSNNTTGSVNITGIFMNIQTSTYLPFGTYVGFTGVNNCPTVLAANSSCTISLTYRPPFAGVNPITVGNNNGGDSITVFYTLDPGQGSYLLAAEGQFVGMGGTATGSFGADAGGVSFGMQAVGTTSAATVLTLTSTGTLPLAVSTVTLGGTDAVQFIISANTCTTMTLAPHASCNVAVEFEPLTNSPSGGFNATLNVADDDPYGTPAPVALSGSSNGAAVVVINDAETIHITDAPTLPVLVVINDPETIHTTDAPSFPLIVIINDPETIHTTDAPTLPVLVVINDAETIHTTDAPAFPLLVVINDPETIHTTDAPTLPVLVVINDPETIHTTDAPAFPLLVVINDPETIITTDAPTLPVLVVINDPETITTADAPAFPLLVVINDPETIHTSDAPTVAETGVADTTTLTSSASVVSSGGSVTLTATVAGGAAGTPGGLVNFYENGGLLCSPALTAGSATCMSPALSAGTYVFRAVYTGSATFAPSTSADITVVATSLNILTVSAQAVSRKYGSANPTLVPTYTGWVNGDGPAVLTGAPTLTTTAGFLSSPGAYPIAVSLAGITGYPSNYYLASVPGVLTVTNGASQTIVFVLPNVPISRSLGPLTLTATTTSGLPVTYTVTSGPATISGSKLTLTGAGTVTITASQPGNSNYAAATSVAASLTVTP